MGNVPSPSFAYSVEVPNTKTDGYTSVYRAGSHPDELVDNFSPKKFNNEWEMITASCEIYGPKRCIGQRLRHEITGALSSKFHWISYKQAHDLALRFGSNLLAMEGNSFEPIAHPEDVYEPARNMTFVGIYSKNRLEWFITEFAASAYNWVLVPLYDSLNKEALDFILKQTQMRVMACSVETLPTILKSARENRILQKVILFLDANEKLSDESLNEAKSYGIEVLLYRDIIAQEPKRIVSPCPGKLDSVNTLCYTSGTTGLPKGVLLTNHNLLACLAAVYRGPIREFLFLDHNDTTISYLPLAHVLERLVSCVVFNVGASIGIFSGDQTLLIKDIQILEPTVFVSVPRLFNRMYDAVARNVSEKTVVAQLLYSHAKNSKLDKLRTNASTTNRVWDPLVFNKVKKMLGNKLRYMISGGAPIDAAIEDNMKILFCVPLLEGYGLTETFGPALLANAKDPLSGHVGGPIPCIEFKLKSEPELEYFVTDQLPRGQLLLRGSSISVGYFLNKPLTDSVFDKDGWFHSGDIAVLLPGGSLKIIDRVKNIFKLSQGEYVSAEKVENVYTLCPLIAQIFVHGFSTQTYLVAIVVPDEIIMEEWIAKHGINKSDATYLASLETEILKQMNKVAKERDLKGFEKVKKIHVEPEQFTVENNLLTPTLKIRRHTALNKYRAIIDTMYNDAQSVT